MLTPLTTPSLVEAPWADKWGGIVLYAETGAKCLWHGANRGGLSRNAPIPLPAPLAADFAAHLVAFATHLAVPPPPPFEDQHAQEPWSCLWLAEQARKAAIQGNWKACGEKVDRVWAIDRGRLAYHEVDAAYAGIRVAGAYGGYFHGDCVALLVPPDKREAVLSVAPAAWGRLS